MLNRLQKHNTDRRTDFAQYTADYTVIIRNIPKLFRPIHMNQRNHGRNGPTSRATCNKDVLRPHGSNKNLRFRLFLVKALINPPPSLSKISYKYNSMSTYIPVSFLLSFIFRVRIRVKIGLGLGWVLGLGFGIGISGAAGCRPQMYN